MLQKITPLFLLRGLIKNLGYIEINFLFINIIVSLFLITKKDIKKKKINKSISGIGCVTEYSLNYNIVFFYIFFIRFLILAIKSELEIFNLILFVFTIFSFFRLYNIFF